MEKLIWNNLTSQQQIVALQRAPRNSSPEISARVAEIIDQVRSQRDAAIRQLTRLLDEVDLPVSQVAELEAEDSISQLQPEVRQAIDQAYSNIKLFHEAGRPSNLSVETSAGVMCHARYTGINRVGLYAPGGSTPLPSSVLMMGVPAQIAGCREIVLCTSPGRNGAIDPAIAYAARLCGVTSVFQIGGAQAIAAMAFGTESVPRCDKLFGPGSVWVTEAKRQVAASHHAITIDMVAGPSEVMVIADGQANATFVASDMLAQVEHGPDSQAILLTDDSKLASQVVTEVDRLSSTLSRKDQIASSLQYSRVIVVENLVEAVELANRYAAEHLIIQTADPESLSEEITAAGSVFLGAWTPEVLGDYCSGTNHVLPTCGLARSVNGLSTADFMKRITIQNASREGFLGLATTARVLAECENLTAHALAVTVRQDSLEAEARS